VETGRSGASRSTWIALLDALDASLDTRDDVLLAAGFAPTSGRRPAAEGALGPLREAARLLLDAHERVPALALDASWGLLDTNRPAALLLHALGLPPSPGLDLLGALVTPGPLRDALLNLDEIHAALWSRARRESPHNPALRARLGELQRFAPRRRAAASGPIIPIRARSPLGDLSFRAAFTSLGAPLEVTATSIRVEHLFPADDRTRAAIDLLIESR